MKSRSAWSRKAASTAGLLSATVTWRAPAASATIVEMPPPNWTTKVFGFVLDHIGVVHRQIAEVGAEVRRRASRMMPSGPSPSMYMPT